MIEKIKNLVGSNGQKGWPVDARDRIAFPDFSEEIITDANVAVTFLWTMRDLVLPKLIKNGLALAANFYSPAGIESMIRNILGNPHIRYIIILGNEFLSEAHASKLTSAFAIRAFFREGVGPDRKIKGLGDAFYLDKNIPLDVVEEIRKNVELIDLNAENEPLDAKIGWANKLIEILPKKEPFAEPRVFGREEATGAFPYEGGPITVHGNNIPEAWLKMMRAVWQYGRPSFMNANTGREVKEVNNMVVVIHNPQDMDLSFNPFLIPLSQDGIRAYQAEILSPELPPTKAYTYGNKLRAYRFPASREIVDLTTCVEYKDFEFKQGPWLDENVVYCDDQSCKINQIADIIGVLKRDPYSKACVAITWHPADELMRKHKSSPCLVSIQALVQDDKLNLTVYFRSHDMTQGWPENAYGCAAIQKEIADAIGVETGLLTIISCSAQIYNSYYKQVEEVLKKYSRHLFTCSDARGNFRIEIKNKHIVVSHLHPVSGKELQKFVGKTAYKLRDAIGQAISLDTAHAIYLGTELAVAELSIKNGWVYEQDTTFQSSNLF